MQVTSTSYCKDTGVLHLMLDDGSTFQITQPAHAAQVRAKISVGGILTGTQLDWLDQYKISPVKTDKTKLLEKLSYLRRQIRKPNATPSA